MCMVCIYFILMVDTDFFKLERTFSLLSSSFSCSIHPVIANSLAAPTTITKMTLWTCGQSDQFFFKPKSHPIAGILMKELDITPVQGRKIVERRDKIRAVCDNIRQCLVLMGRLKSLCQHKQKVFRDRMTKCQEILNPLQVARLLVWVDNHADTLESVCPGWGSERMSKRSAVAGSAVAPPAAASSTPKLPTKAGEAAKDGAK